MIRTSKRIYKIMKGSYIHGIAYSQNYWWSIEDTIGLCEYLRFCGAHIRRVKQNYDTGGYFDNVKYRLPDDLSPIAQRIFCEIGNTEDVFFFGFGENKPEPFDTHNVGLRPSFYRWSNCNGDYDTYNEVFAVYKNGSFIELEKAESYGFANNYLEDVEAPQERPVAEQIRDLATPDYLIFITREAFPEPGYIVSRVEI